MTRRKSAGISEAFRRRVDHWVVRTQLVPASIRIRHMTSLWAVCHVDKSITFSRALLDQPEAFQDLVIVHELIHLAIPDHSKWFYLALPLYLPDWRATARLAPESPADRVHSDQIRDVATTRISVRSQRVAGLTAHPVTS
jgi:predicted metal-dependent hydrolase